MAEIHFAPVAADCDTNVAAPANDIHQMPATFRMNRNLIYRMRLLVVILLSVASIAEPKQAHWVGSWATSQQLAESGNAIPAADLKDVTLRQIVHLSIGGTELRLRLSNRFGAIPVRFTAVHLARPFSPNSSRIDPASDIALKFSGRPDVIIPAGADYLSDPITYPMRPSADLAISFHLEEIPATQDGHLLSRATSYLVHGNHVSQTNFSEAREIEHWYYLAGVEVQASPGALAVVALGDSITDGRGSTTNANNRWTDVLAHRLADSSSTKHIAVLNHGIGGNQLLGEGAGPNALARFDQDVLSQAGVRHLMILEGINDIGTLTKKEEQPPAEHDELVHRMIGAYEQLIMRAHTQGIKVTGCTILPFAGNRAYHPGANSEKDRQRVNDWIRTSGRFDFVVDFDQLVRDPKDPQHMLTKYDSGDHLHPSPEGYAVMGEAVPLSNFLQMTVLRSGNAQSTPRR